MNPPLYSLDILAIYSATSYTHAVSSRSCIEIEVERIERRINTWQPNFWKKYNIYYIILSFKDSKGTRKIK